jgi:hypothetical protein
MPRQRLLLYGWYDEKRGKFFVSKLPPDAPVRPAVPLDSINDVQAMLDRKRADIYWWPPLPPHISEPRPIDHGPASFDIGRI